MMDPSHIIMTIFTSSLFSHGEKNWYHIGILLLLSIIMKYYKNIYLKIYHYWKAPTNYINIHSENSNGARNIVYSAIMWYLGDKIKSEATYEQSSVNTDFSKFYSDDRNPYKKFPIYDVMYAKELIDDGLTYTFDYEKVHEEKIRYTKYCITIKGNNIEQVKQKIAVINDKYKTYLKNQAQKKIVTDGFIIHIPHKNPNNYRDKPIWDYKIVNINKTFDNLFISDKIKTNIKKSINRLTNDDNYYKKFAIPRKLTLLLHGDPGCGKTSLYITLANEFKMPIYIVNDKKTVENHVKEIPDGSIIVFEEIDIFGIKNRGKVKDEDDEEDEDENEIKKRNKNDESKENLRLILELLDGYYTLPEKSIVVLTTNYLSCLDSAVYRKGRVDYLIELEKPNREIIQTIFKYYYNEVLITEEDLKKLDGKLPTCEYTNSILLNIDNQQEAINELLKLTT